MSRELPMIAHLLEQYADTNGNYMYEQVTLVKDYRCVMLCERKNTYDYYPFDNYHCLWRESKKHALVNKALIHAFKKPLHKPFVQVTTRWFEHHIRKSGARLIHAHFGTMGAKYSGLREKLGIPLVVSFYGVDVSSCVRDPFWVPRYKEMFRAGDRMIVLCEEAEERLLRLGCPREKIRIWDIGIPTEEYPYRAPTDRGDAVRFLMVARFIEKKGHVVLLEAFRMLAAKNPHATLTLVGMGPLKAELEATIARSGLADRVKLVDTSKMNADFFDLFKEMLRTHDIFVLPSVIAKNGDDEGGCPVVITNAMSAGLPVISTSVGGITRAITDGVSGILSDSGNAGDLAEKMARLASDPGLRLNVSRKAREKIEADFDLKKQIRRLEAIYAELL